MGSIDKQQEIREPSKTIKEAGFSSLEDFAEAVNMNPQWIRKRYHDNRKVFDALLRGSERKTP